jgi:hypothetical protein
MTSSDRFSQEWEKENIKTILIKILSRKTKGLEVTSCG